MKEQPSTTSNSNLKIRLFAVVGILAVIAVAATVFFLSTRDQTQFREISIFEAEADATVLRKEQTIDTYKGMKLENGDRLTVGSEGFIRLLLDDDKYVTLEPKTEIELLAAGDSKDSKTEIKLISGAILNEINNELSKDSSYEIHTPNSVMAVRGTVFRVAMQEQEDECLVDLAVLDGKVGCALVSPDGNISDEEILVTVGQSAQFQSDENDVRTVFSGEEIDYSSLPELIQNRILELKKNGRLDQLPLTEKELEEKLDATNHKNPTDENSTANTAESKVCVVTFLDADGNLFATQKVEKGSKASMPTLSPSTGSAWYDKDGAEYHFDTAVTEDLTLTYR